MFKSVQKYLLVNHPLLWNTRVVPAVICSLLAHIIFFAIGYVDGTVDFSQSNTSYGDPMLFFVIFISIVVSILFFVMWLVYFARNNAFKSFYPQRNGSLYKQWIIITIISILNISYSLSYVTAKNLRTRSYYSEQQTRQRCETISMASIFIHQEYENYESNYALDTTAAVVDSNTKNYKKKSLINKSVLSFPGSFEGNAEMKVKSWMEQNDQIAIKKLMQRYFALIKEHHLATNIEVDQWFKATYDFPNFTNYDAMPDRESNSTAGYPYTDASGTTVVESKAPNLYLPQRTLQNSYTTIATAWEQPLVDLDVLYMLVYIGFGIGMLLFSFKVTSGRNIIIALLAVGILGIVTGIMGAFAGSGTAFLVIWLILIIASVCHFFFKLYTNEGKSISAITLNVVLWFIPAFLPLLYSLAMIYYNQSNRQYDSNYMVSTKTPEYDWLVSHIELCSILNILIIFAFMAYFCSCIKKWKSLAES